jgi:D-arabinose 1-dehydrogenase-like Zn-dependent alcohol dehydrogenase
MPRNDARRAFELPRTSRPAVGTIGFVTVLRDRIVLASSRQNLALAPTVPVKTHIEPYRLTDANRALKNLRDGHVQGAAVLVM